MDLSDVTQSKSGIRRDMGSVGTFSINFRFQIGGNTPNTSTVTQTFIRTSGG